MNKDWYKETLNSIIQAYKEDKLEEWLATIPLDIYVTHRLNSKDLESAEIVLTVGRARIYIDTGDSSIHCSDIHHLATYAIPADVNNKISEIIQEWIDESIAS